MTLKDKHESFCEEYVKDSNAKQAAIRAGYSPKTAKQQGHRLLTYVDVQERVAELKAEAAERNRITVDSLLGRFQDVYDGATAKGQYAAATRSLELQGKLIGLFTERQDVRMRTYTAAVAPEDLDSTIERYAKLCGYTLTRKEQ